MNFIKAILISLLAIVIMDKLYSYIKSRSEDLSKNQRSNFISTLEETTLLVDKPVKQIIAKTRKDKFSL